MIIEQQILSSITSFLLNIKPNSEMQPREQAR